MKVFNAIKEILGFCLIVLCLYIGYISIVAHRQTSERIDRANVEFQIVVEDSTITVWDRETFIGRVKLQGELDSLMVDVNQ
jgi:Ca2+/Na+ antiporter